MALIYKIQNKLDNKIYIGQTKRTLEWRLSNGWCGHFPAAFEKNSKGYFHNALRKYGKNAFSYEILEERDNSSFQKNEDIKAWLDEREIYWITYYKSNEHQYGYNKTKGGSFDYQKADHSYHSKRMTEYNNKCWADSDFREKRSKKVSEQFKKQWKNDAYRTNIIEKMKHTISLKSCEDRHNSAMKSVETKRRLGLLCQTDEAKEKLRKAALGNTNVKGRLYIHKEGKSRMVKPEELERYLSEGWVKGRGKVKWS